MERRTLRWATKRLPQTKLKVITEYSATDTVELDLKVGEIITLLETDDNGWAEGCNELGSLKISPTLITIRL
jgi:hypothetical protein